MHMASRLVVYFKTRPQQRTKYFLWFQNRKARRHLRGKGNPQFLFAGSLFVGNRFASFPKAFEMAFDGVARHLSGLVEGSTVGNETGQKRNSDLISRPRGILRTAEPPAIAPPNPGLGERFKNHREAEFTGFDPPIAHDFRHIEIL